MINGGFDEKVRRIVISRDIDDDTAHYFLEQLTTFEYIDINKPIHLYINSDGGSIDSAIMIYDSIKTCCSPVYTYGIGRVFSAGVLILCSGEKGHRYISANSRAMIHEISCGMFGGLTELNTTQKEVNRIQDLYISLLAKDTGQAKEKILKDMKNNTFMTAQECISYGIVDLVMPTKKIKMLTEKDIQEKVKKIKRKLKV